MPNIDAINIADIIDDNEDDDSSSEFSFSYTRYIVLFFILLIMHTEIVTEYIIVWFGQDTIRGRCLTNKGLMIMCSLTILLFMLYEWFAEKGYF